MSEPGTVPSYITDIIGKGDTKPEISCFVTSDIRLNGTFGETWIVFSNDKVHIIDVADPPRSPAENRSFAAKVIRRLRRYLKVPQKVKPLPPPGPVTIAETLDKSAIDSLAAENLVTGGLLTGKVNGRERLICRYTGTTAPQFHAFIALFNRIKGGRIDTAEDNEKNKQARCPRCNRPLSEWDGTICKACLNRRALFLRVLSYVPRYKKQTTLVLLCIIASSALGLLNPYIGGSVFFDKVLSPAGKYHGHILEAVLVMMGAQIVSLLLSIASGRVNAKMTAYVVYDLKTEVFTALQRLSLSFYSHKQTGSLITSVNDNAMQLQYFFHDGMPFLLVNAVSLSGIIAVMLMMDWRLALLAGIPAPIGIAFVKKAFPRIWALLSRRWRASAAMFSVLSDNLSGIRVVKAFGKEATEILRFSRTSERVRNADLDLGTISAVTFPLTGFVMGLGGLIVWTVGSFREVSGAITLGTLITFTGYIGMIYGRLEFLTHVVDWWSSCMNAAHRIFEILDTRPEVAEDLEPVRLSIKGAVRIDNVTFGYEPLNPVLHDVSFEIKAGEMVGLVGHSGAGKSTIVNIITRLYDVQQGAIYIDDVPVKKIAIDSLRSQIGMVLQETFLFAGTIAENIAFARPEASRAQIMDAARAANAHQFITGLADGYETILGKHGYNLSGGERQRIAIARAILHDPRILILDEATASVDTETERQIQEAMARLIKGRTTIAIAHRLSTLRNADRLVVIEKGRVVEWGTHEELASKEGVYCSMLKKQREALKITGAV